MMSNETTIENGFGIVISYRRDDTAGHAGRLYDHLAAHFGEGNVFIDIDAIPLGADWVEHIKSTLERCDILLALIGRRWLTVTDDRGHRRIDDPDDFLRREIASALERRDIRVIPVRLQGAELPAVEDLPDELARLPRRQAYRIDEDRWHHDVRELTNVLQGFKARKEQADAAAERTRREEAEHVAAEVPPRDEAARQPREEEQPLAQETEKAKRSGATALRRLGWGGGLVILGIILALFWNWLIGLIIALIGLIAFGGFARGRWY